MAVHSQRHARNHLTIISIGIQSDACRQRGVVDDGDAGEAIFLKFGESSLAAVDLYPSIARQLKTIVGAEQFKAGQGLVGFDLEPGGCRRETQRFG
ncbi:MAG TPA: hypothetical protein ENN66_09640 [Proteobacteria bacterium]|nr:hypothetical protein [Pseudomonadota bacterium]